MAPPAAGTAGPDQAGAADSPGVGAGGLPASQSAAGHPRPAVETVGQTRHHGTALTCLVLCSTV